MFRTSLPAHSPRRSWLAWLCLLGLVGSLSWVRLLAVAGLALLDGSHSVRVGGSGEGWTVVLGHPTSGSGMAVLGSSGGGRHEHGSTAQMLLALSDSGPGETDHVLRIEGAAPARSVVSVSVPLPSNLLAWSAQPAFPMQAGPADREPRLQSRPPPVPAVFLAQLRTTILVV